MGVRMSSKSITPVLIGTVSFLLAGCGGVSQEEVDAQIEEAVGIALAEAETERETAIAEAVREALDTQAEEFAAAEENQLEAAKAAFTSAVDECGLDTSPFVDVDDGGMMLAGLGEESQGLPSYRTFCILEELEIPQSIVTRIENTNSTMGLVEGEWGDYRASWTYHPNNGLNVFVEAQD